MTAIFYADCQSSSNSGRYTIEARSPHNGTIRHRDGRKPSEAEFAYKYRQHQSDFRYRLLDNAPHGVLGQLLRGAGPRVVWERWQEKREDSPGELVVSEEGWSVIRTHGFRPEVIAVAPDGMDVVRVRVVWADGERHESSPDARTPLFFWPVKNLACSTAGHYWAGHSWRHFFRWRGEPYFAWRTSRGQRLVLDLARDAAYTDGQHLPDGLFRAAEDAERESVVALLGALSRRMDEVRALFGRKGEGEEHEANQLVQWVRQASAALRLVGVHRLYECVPYLREWEAVNWPSVSMGSSAMTGRWWLQTQHVRPAAHHALKLLGEEPLGFPTYGFTAGEFASPERFPVPERLPDRRGRAALLTREMTAGEVLHLLGSPDFIRRRSREVGGFYRWSEDWEYDFQEGATWRTLRLTWEERRREGRMTAAEWVAPYWLESDERAEECLEF
jgi:hypothetical protein